MRRFTVLSVMLLLLCANLLSAHAKTDSDSSNASPSHINKKVAVVMLCEAGLVIGIVFIILKRSKKEQTAAYAREVERRETEEAQKPQGPKYINITTAASELVSADNTADDPFTVPMTYGKEGGSITQTDLIKATDIEQNGGNQAEESIYGSIGDAADAFTPYVIPEESEYDRGSSSLFDMPTDDDALQSFPPIEAENEPEQAPSAMVFDMISEPAPESDFYVPDEYEAEDNTGSAGSVFDILSDLTETDSQQKKK